MMRPTRIDARGRTRNGVAILDYLKETEGLGRAAPEAGGAGDYYASGDEPRARATSRWLGRGAVRLGLEGAVDGQAMDALARGFDPNSGDALSQTAGCAARWVPQLDRVGQPVRDRHDRPKGTWRGGHRVGFDCTFSIAPKSVSLAFAAADAAERVRILDAMRDAVAQTVAVMETMIEAPRGRGGAEKIGIGGLVASGFTHFSSRELEPQLHEHVLVYAVAPGADGKWGGWEALQLYEHQAMFGALARAAFAQNLHAVGYGIVKNVERDDRGRPTGEVYFELAGVDERTCRAFSTRRRQILDHVRLHGGTKQQAALATRKPKEEPPFEEVDRLWQDALEQARRHDPSVFKSTADLKGRASTIGSVSDEDILERLQTKDAVWTKQQLIAQLAREHVGQKNVVQILGEADAFLQRMAPSLVIINPERPTDAHHSGQRSGRAFAEVRYCSKRWFEEVEQRLVDGARRRQHEPQHAVPLATSARAIAQFEMQRGFSPTAEQRRAIDHVLGPSGVVLMTGRAGSGKTMVADIFVRAFQAEGREVIGAALSWSAAQKLGEETGLERVYSTAKLLSELDRGRLHLTARHVVLLDEAGMANSTTIRRLQEHIDKAGAKFVLQGDSQQLAPVEAGQGFRLLRDAVGDVELTEIRRQRRAQDVETSHLFYTHAGRRRRTTARNEQQALGTQILERLEQHDQVVRTDIRDEAIEALVDDYFASSVSHHDKLIMASTHTDVVALNEAVRRRLIQSGEVSADEHTMVLKHGRHRVERSVAVGDRLRFGRLDEEMGVMNGTLGVVDAIKSTAKGSFVLTLRLELNGRVVKLDTASYGELDYAYARTVDKAQGATVAEAYFLASVGRMDVHLSLVAATRYRDRFTMYATESDLESLQERMGMERLRVNALEEGRWRGLEME